MVSRGLWNLHVDGKWYRSCRLRGRISSPGDEVTFQRIKQLQETARKTDEWEPVPFPRILRPSVFRIDLASIHKASDLSTGSLLQNARRPLQQTSSPTDEQQTESIISGTLKINFSPPTPLNELQHRLFTDFTFLWRFYIDHPTIWLYPSPLFNTLTSPETDVYWFHGFLIVLCGALDTVPSVTAAVLRAKAFLVDSRRMQDTAHLILISLHHVAIVELSCRSVLCSAALPPIKSSAHREWWGNMRPKNIVSFCQASLAVENGTLHRPPQFGDFKVRSFEFSVPCIGLDCRPPGRQYLCCDCQENKTCSTLDPGGINQASRRRKRGPGCHVNVAGRPKILQLRLSRPAYLRPELRLLGNLVSIPPSLIDYAIHFGGVFSGRMLG
ncbi:hypothetical protein M432DRAFT_629133 [Thermoascus aurantiacus ATCC 26904]